MIRIDVNAGHGAGMPLSKTIDLTFPISVYLFNTGIGTTIQSKKYLIFR